MPARSKVFTLCYVLMITSGMASNAHCMMDNLHTIPLNNQKASTQQTNQSDQIENIQLAVNKEVMESCSSNLEAPKKPQITGEGPYAEKVIAYQNICYRVQIAAAPKPMSTEELQAIYKGPLEVKSFEEKGYFKYYIAEVDSYELANKLRLSSGVKGAFIVKCPGNASKKQQSHKPEE